MMKSLSLTFINFDGFGIQYPIVTALKFDISVNLIGPSLGVTVG